MGLKNRVFSVRKVLQSCTSFSNDFFPSWNQHEKDCTPQRCCFCPISGSPFVLRSLNARPLGRLWGPTYITWRKHAWNPVHRPAGKHLQQRGRKTFKRWEESGPSGTINTTYRGSKPRRPPLGPPMTVDITTTVQGKCDYGGANICIQETDSISENNSEGKLTSLHEMFAEHLWNAGGTKHDPGVGGAVGACIPGLCFSPPKRVL